LADFSVEEFMLFKGYNKEFGEFIARGLKKDSYV
jgi:hypothetical protein